MDSSVFLENINNLKKNSATLEITPEYLNSDTRYLIPFMQDGKVGLINHNAEIVINANYDYIGTCASEDSLMIIRNGTNYSRRVGVINAKGEFILPMEYNKVGISDDQKLYTLRSQYPFRECVIDINKNIIVPEGKYKWIDSYCKGFARVWNVIDIGGWKERRYGIIDTKGREVIPLEYTNICSIKPQYNHILAIKNGLQTIIQLSDISTHD